MVEKFKAVLPEKQGLFTTFFLFFVIQASLK